jgi:tetratricopeptide (TPR) repeat protein
MTMKPKPGFRFLLPATILLTAFLGFCRVGSAAETNAAAAEDKTDKSADNTAIGAQDFLRSYLQLQEQLRDTQLAIQKIRQETAALDASNSAVVDERLQLMEKTIANENNEQLNGIAHLNRTILSAAGVFASVAFLVLLTAVCLQWAAVNRLAAATTLAASRPARGPEPLADLQPTTHALEQSNMRFLALMDQLEERLHHLEDATHTPKSLTAGAPSNGSTTGYVPAEKSSAPASEKNNTVSLLISKSQTLLKLDEAKAALDCLDEALSIEPNNAEVLVKKGAALEHLHRVNEALECYDRAIAQDASMTMAYLHKGTLFTRLERHGEALACYEQALKPRKTAGNETSSTEPSIDLAQ